VYKSVRKFQAYYNSISKYKYIACQVFSTEDWFLSLDDLGWSGFLEPDCDPDCHQNSICCFLGHVLPIQKNSLKVVRNFLSTGNRRVKI